MLYKKLIEEINELKYEIQRLRQTEKEYIDFLRSKTTRHNESVGNTYRRPPFIRPYD